MQKPHLEFMAWGLLNSDRLHASQVAGANVRRETQALHGQVRALYHPASNGVSRSALSCDGIMTGSLLLKI